MSTSRLVTWAKKDCWWESVFRDANQSVECCTVPYCSSLLPSERKPVSALAVSLPRHANRGIGWECGSANTRTTSLSSGLFSYVNVWRRNQPFSRLFWLDGYKLLSRISSHWRQSLLRPVTSRPYLGFLQPVICHVVWRHDTYIWMRPPTALHQSNACSMHPPLIPPTESVARFLRVCKWYGRNERASLRACRQTQTATAHVFFSA